jgi:hypothetical protein
MKVIEAETLTTFEVAQDGARVRFNCKDADGGAVCLSLPVDSMMQMVMTLPRIARQALRRHHGDDSLRLVYPAGSWLIEGDIAQPETLIVTLSTVDGFEVSFSIDPPKLRAMEDTLGEASVRCETVHFPVLN